MSLLVCALNENHTMVCSEDRAGVYDASGNFTVTREGLLKSIQVTPSIIFASTGSTLLAARLMTIVQDLGGSSFGCIAETVPLAARELLEQASEANKKAGLIGLLAGWDGERHRMRGIGWHWSNNFAPIETESGPNTRYMAFGPNFESQDRAVNLLQQGATMSETFTQLGAEFPQVGRTLHLRKFELTPRDGEVATVGPAAPSWTLGAGVALLTANDFVNSGAKALKISNTAGANSISKQNVSVVGGLIYVVEGWIKTDAITTISGHGGWLNVSAGSGVTGFTIITKFGAADMGLTSTPSIGIAANGSAHAYTFVQCYFVPNTSGSISIGLQAISNNAANVWFDDVKCYPHNGPVYQSLTASTAYYLYSKIDGTSGAISFINGNPPGTSPSDSLALQCSEDGFIACAPVKITTPTTGSSGTTTGGGSGTCPEFDAPVYIRRYSDAGEIVFDGQIKAGDVRQGDALKGYSFAKQADVYRPVQHWMHVTCGGWMAIEGVRYTACETIWDGSFTAGAWLPAWKVPGAKHNSKPGIKVQIQVKADADDEHNYYAGTRLIHNGIILPC
jgi:hypothetical protein